MRFLLELVSCCGSQEKGCVGSEASSPRENEEAYKMEERRSLVASVHRNYRRKRRGRLGGGSGVGVAEWKPSLYAISEDNVVMEKDKSSETERERLPRRKSGGSHKARARVRSYKHEFRGSSMPNVIPAFSPTPFMF